MSRARPRRQAAASALEPDASLLDLVDNLLNKGVVITGELTLGLARIDLVYVQLSALIAAADRVLPSTRQPRARDTRDANRTLAGWFRTPPRRSAHLAPPRSRGTSRRPPITRPLGTMRTSPAARARRQA